MKSKTVNFYDRYHKQNAATAKLINRNNITYWHIIRLVEQAVPNLSNKKVLDIGCGVGTMSFFLAQQGADVLGIDVSERAIELANYTQQAAQVDGVKFIHAGLSGTTDPTVPKKTLPAGFDLITCFEVIEHIPDDATLLKDCYSKLKPGGKLVLTTQRNDGWLAKTGYFNAHDERVGHCHRYKPVQLLELIRGAGFTIVVQQPADGLIRSLLYTTALGFLLKFVRGPLIPIFQWLDQLTIPLFGAADIQIIAVKR